MPSPSRFNGRAPDALRPTRITPHFLKYAEGSALIEVGDTKVICAVSVEEKLPPFMKDKGEGWITSEYAMLPRAATQRSAREATRGKQGGRTMEIQRLVGRALRGACDLKALGERTLWIDCDVIQADGGTRTASITGAFVALALAASRLLDDGKLRGWPIKEFVAATSVGMVDGVPLLDLDYQEDSRAEVDMNVVGNEKGRMIEVQGTAERGTFDEAELLAMLACARKGIAELIAIQRQVLAPVTDTVEARMVGALKDRFRSLR